MSDNQKKVEVFKDNAVADIKIPVEFYKRIQNLFLEMIDSHKTDDMKELKQATEKIKQGNQALLPWEESLETVLILINTVEEEYRKSGFSEFQDVPLSDKV